MSRGIPRFSLQSQTWKDISALLGKLPARRKRLVGFVLLASIFQGLLDLLLIAFLARFVGLFSGAKLADRLPGVLVFGGGILDQTGWLLALLIGSFWLTSLVRFLVSLMQSLLSAEVWNDLVNQVYANVLQQPQISHKVTNKLCIMFVLSIVQLGFLIIESVNSNITLKASCLPVVRSGQRSVITCANFLRGI